MDDFENYRFHEEIYPDMVRKGNLYVVTGEELLEFDPIETINFPNGETAFKIIDLANEDK